MNTDNKPAPLPEPISLTLDQVEPVLLTLDQVQHIAGGLVPVSWKGGIRVLA